MKFKDSFGSQMLAALCLFAVLLVGLPLLLLFLLFKLLCAPIDYIRYKRSRYQRDFPHPYEWLREPHADNEVYTAIRENGLPVAYIKHDGEYYAGGFFVYRDALLVFSEPFYYDAEDGQWYFVSAVDGAEEMGDEENESEKAPTRFTPQEARRVFLEELRAHTSGYECRDVIFFYRRDSAIAPSGEESLKALRALDFIVLYERRELARAIETFIEKRE